MPSGQVDEVVVTGFRGSLEKSIELKREAIGIRDSIVAEDIGKFPEANVAESLQRIPGVAVTRDDASNEGNRISIRGLGSQYSVTTINGAPVRTTSSGNVGGASRDFNYDVFASELFGRVDFYKTPLAELEEGGIGGVVELRTPRPFDAERTVRLSATASYNTTSEHLDPNVFALYSNTWGNWGFLIGGALQQSINIRSGFEATGNYNSSFLGSQNQGPFSFALDYDDPRANLGGLTREQVDNGFLPRFYRYFGAENDRERTGIVSSVQYQADKLDVSLDVLYSELTDSRDEFTWGLPIRNSRTDPGTTVRPGLSGNNGFVPIDITLDPESNLLEGTFGDTTILNENVFADSSTDFRSVSLNGSYEINDRLSLSGQTSFSKSDAYRTFNRFISNVYEVTSTLDYTNDHVYPALTVDVDPTDPNVYQDFGIGFDWRQEIDEVKTAKLVADFDYDLFAGITGHLKGGVSYVSSKKETLRRDGSDIGNQTLAAVGQDGMRAAMIRAVPLNNMIIGSGFPQRWAVLDRGFMENRFDPIGAAHASAPDYAATFTAEEQVSTVFIQSDFVGSIRDHEWRLNAGVRYSATDTLIDNYDRTTIDDAVTFAPRHREGDYDNVLPSLSFSFDILDNLVWRASYGETITRASLSIIAANTVIPNIFETRATSGNPNLLPQTSENYNSSLEWYFGNSGLLSVGWFKNELTDTTVSTTTIVPFSSLGLPDNALGPIFIDPATGRVPPDLPINLETYYNAGGVTYDGWEFAYQQDFAFLPAPFDGFGALASYTRVNTTGYEWTTTDGRVLEVNTVPKYTYSATGYYEKGPFAIRLTYNYSDRTIIETSNTGNDLQRWNAGRGYLDGNISYQVNDTFEIRFDALNILDELDYDYFPDVSGRYGNARKSRIDYAKYTGQTLKLGVRARF